jgi:hypothetical protein
MNRYEREAEITASKAWRRRAIIKYAKGLGAAAGGIALLGALAFSGDSGESNGSVFDGIPKPTATRVKPQEIIIFQNGVKTTLPPGSDVIVIPKALETPTPTPKLEMGPAR